MSRRRKQTKYLYNLPKGSPRWYLWRGTGTVKYRVDPKAPDFERVYGLFLMGLEPNQKPENLKKSVEKAFSQGLAQVYKSSPFIHWQKARKDQLKLILEDAARELVNPEKPELGKVGGVELDRIKLNNLQRLIDRKIEQGLSQDPEERKKKPRGGYGAAVNRRKAFRWAWRWFRRNDLVKENVALDLDKLKVPKEYQRRHTILEAEIRQFRKYWAIGTKARLGFELGLAGCARSDAVRVGPTNLREDADGAVAGILPSEDPA
jgi:hypothetical protein